MAGANRVERSPDDPSRERKRSGKVGRSDFPASLLTAAGETAGSAMLRQSPRLDGNQIQDAYELRLDGSLPERDGRDRDPGANGWR